MGHRPTYCPKDSIYLYKTKDHLFLFSWAKTVFNTTFVESGNWMLFSKICLGNTVTEYTINGWSR